MGKKFKNTKYISLFFLFAITSCIQVGPTQIAKEDNQPSTGVINTATTGAVSTENQATQTGEIDKSDTTSTSSNGNTAIVNNSSLQEPENPVIFYENPASNSSVSTVVNVPDQPKEETNITKKKKVIPSNVI